MAKKKTPGNDNPTERFARVKVPRELEDEKRRVEWGLPKDADERGRYIVELNLQHIEGLPGAAATLRTVCRGIREDLLPRRVSKTYYACHMTVPEVRALAVADEKQAADAAAAQTDEQSAVGSQRYAAIFRIWPDFQVKSHIDASVATVKADAAKRAYAASGHGIVWAVLDSGVDFRHLHFGRLADEAATATAADRERSLKPVAGHTLLDDSVASLHRCFCALKETDEYDQVQETYLEDPDDEELKRLPDKDRGAARLERINRHRQFALSDPFGHGTHVAGIIGGGLSKGSKALVFQREFKADGKSNSIQRSFGTRTVADAERLRGVAPECKIVSLRVLDEEGNGRTSDVISALEYIREKLNDDPKLLRVHGVNLSVGYEFDAELFACGQSPVCAEVDRLVQAGVVVVTAAGNTGYGQVSAWQRVSKVGLSNTINDPGNAALGITVGATHRDAPHTYGVSYFSSKGPTGDGRLKPDLVAPGERITSCAAGRMIEQLRGCKDASDAVACYVDESGTSMAAPHVSGAIAAFLSIRREFIGKPLEIKRIFLQSATPLGRERYFEGHGLVDLMRAIQSV